MPHPRTGLDPIEQAIDSLRFKQEPSESLSFRISGKEFETWALLKEDHPEISASELLKEGIRLRRLADIAAAIDAGLFMRLTSGEQVNALDLLGFSKARKRSKEDVALRGAVAKTSVGAGQPNTKRPRPQKTSSKGPRSQVEAMNE